MNNPNVGREYFSEVSLTKKLRSRALLLAARLRPGWAMSEKVSWLALAASGPG